MLEVQKLAILSTAHITPETNEWLETRKFDEENGPNGGKTPYGYFLHVPGEDIPADVFPKDLLDVFDFGRRHGCFYVYLDRDGEIVDELASFDW